LFPGGFTFPNFLADVFSIFIFVLWFWLLITVFGDLFRRRDISGLGKVLWVIVVIVLPYLGIFVYLITQGRGMAERQSGGPSRRVRSFVKSSASAWPTNSKNSNA
jgi:predicted membrane channel-forming protein YqfA (hemolysin III family)